MKRNIIILGIFVCLAGSPAFAQPWSGFLVDSDCYDSELRNTNPAGSISYVDRDKDADVRFCAPNAKTKSFAIVDHDGLSFKLDAAGNAKAAAITRQAAKKQYLKVVVTGERRRSRVQVDSISVAD